VDCSVLKSTLLDSTTMSAHGVSGLTCAVVMHLKRWFFDFAKICAIKRGIAQHGMA
jgi:hypothetical protein